MVDAIRQPCRAQALHVHTCQGFVQFFWHTTQRQACIVYKRPAAAFCRKKLAAYRVKNRAQLRPPLRHISHRHRKMR